MNDFTSCAFLDKIFIPFLTTFINYNGDCSSVAERATVARITGVRFSPIALQKKKKMKKRNKFVEWIKDFIDGFIVYDDWYWPITKRIIEKEKNKGEKK